MNKTRCPKHYLSKDTVTITIKEGSNGYNGYVISVNNVYFFNNIYGID